MKGGKCFSFFFLALVVLCIFSQITWQHTGTFSVFPFCNVELTGSAAFVTRESDLYVSLILLHFIDNCFSYLFTFSVDRAEKAMENDPNQQCLTATVQLEVSNAPWCYRSQFDPVAHGLDASFRLTKFSELRG